MQRLTFTAMSLLIAAAALATTDPAGADANAPVCAQTYGKSDGLACNYATYEQCRAAISGIAGGCVDNPYFRAGSNQISPRKRGKP